jgi:dihydroneopterin aldolase
MTPRNGSSGAPHLEAYTVADAQIAGSDRLSVRSMVCMCRIGVTEEERSRPQKLEIDLDLYSDLEPAGRSGDVAQTIDYLVVTREVRAHLESTSFHLIEAAARTILDRLLERFRVQRAAVRVRKFILPDVAHIEVEMERARAGSTGQPSGHSL